ncbi:MAG: HIT family protein [Ahrensia sp.]|nr:HIT family protein [Ahrensia sp.]
MTGAGTTWQLDARLKADTFPISSLKAGELLLMNDARWLWLILVPRLIDAQEWHDIPEADLPDLSHCLAQVGRQLKAHTGCEKINIAAIGNMVRQLHIHIIAREVGDPNWPGPVWGYGQRAAYSADEATRSVKDLQALFDDPSLY